jgi:hypothetical protein
MHAEHNLKIRKILNRVFRIRALVICVYHFAYQYLDHKLIFNFSMHIISSSIEAQPTFTVQYDIYIFYETSYMYNAGSMAGTKNTILKILLLGIFDKVSVGTASHACHYY